MVLEPGYTGQWQSGLLLASTPLLKCLSHQWYCVNLENFQTTKCGLLLSCLCCKDRRLYHTHLEHAQLVANIWAQVQYKLHWCLVLFHSISPSGPCTVMLLWVPSEPVKQTHLCHHWPCELRMCNSLGQWCHRCNIMMETRNDGAFGQNEADITMVSSVIQASNYGKYIFHSLQPEWHKTA